MEALVQIGIFIISLTVLVKASDYFIESAEKIGLSFGISPFIIGVTIVAFGTSLPELATSIVSVLSDNSEIVVGNVIGSNITNILLVLGLTAIVGRKVLIDDDLLDLDMPVLIGSALFLMICLRDHVFSLFEAVLFLLGLIVFLLKSVFKDDDDEVQSTKVTPLSYVILIVAGALVALSADFTIGAVEKLSAMMNVNKEIIALSVIALGTSLPEVVVSIQCARKGKSGMAVGNVLGSNIFNTLAVMSIPRFFGPLKIPTNIMEFSLPLMLIATALFFIMTLNKKITRWEGATLLILYVYFFGELYQAVV